MKLLIKVSKFSLFYYYFIISLAILPITSYAQYVVDASAPDDLMVEPMIVMTAVTVTPTCHTYTGCGVIVVEKPHYHRYKHYKHKRHCAYHHSCCVVGGCYMRQVIGPYW